MAIKVSVSIHLLLVVFFVASPITQVIRCQSDAEFDTVDSAEGGDHAEGDFGDATLSSASGVDTMCVFPHNSARLIMAGEKTEILVGVNNEGKSTLTVSALRASVHFSFDHSMVVQNLTAQFYNASVPVSTQATFPYMFAVSEYLQSGTYDLVGTIFYEIDQNPYQSVFYNGAIEVVEAGGFLSMESVLLISLGLGLIGMLGLWVYGQIQNISKKTKKVPKVEVGTKTMNPNLDEWLVGTAYTQSLSTKSKKKR